MGRPHSPEHRQAVVDDWRRRLVVVAWRQSRGVGDGQLLALTIGIDWAAANATQRRRLRAAIRTLRVAVEPASGASARPDHLDAWIDRYLVRPGVDLLLSGALRRTVLDRARDAHRRQVHGDRGFRSARLEMSEESWTRLKAIRAELGAAKGDKVTLSAALEHIITAHGQKRLGTTPNKARAQRQASSNRGDDLLSRLETYASADHRGDDG